mgnify:CR=1 FL=1
MKKYFLLLAAAAAAVAITSCGKDGKTVDPDSAEDAEAHLVAYFPLDSQAAAVSVGEGISFAELGGSGEFTESGFKGGAYNNASSDHETQAFLKLNVPADFLSTKSSFTVTAWVNTPSQRGGIITFGSSAAKVDANWGAWDLFFDGGHDQGTTLKGYMLSTETEWGGFYPSYKGLEVAQNKWIQLAYSYDESTSWANLYVNATLVGTPTEEDGTILGTSQCFAGPEKEDGTQDLVGKIVLPEVNSLYIGAFASRESGASSETWLSYFAGKIDEVRIYDKALSAKQLQTVYKNEVKESTGLDN